MLHIRRRLLSSLVVVHARVGNEKTRCLAPNNSQSPIGLDVWVHLSRVILIKP